MPGDVQARSTYRDRNGKRVDVGYVQRSINAGEMAHLTVVEANDVARIETALTEIADNRCTDRNCDLDCGKRHLDTLRAFTGAEVLTVLDAADQAKADVGELARFLFGTGVRISEALHCTEWDDVDLDAGTVLVRGTKTAQADRKLGLGPDLVERLRQRAERHGTTCLVFGITYFHSNAGQPQDSNTATPTSPRSIWDARSSQRAQLASCCCWPEVNHERTVTQQKPW